MSKHLLGGLGDIAQSGLFRAAVRNWWLTLPVGLVAWHSIQKRRKAGTLTTMHVIGDMVPVITVVGTLVLLNHTLEEREKAKPSRPALSAPPTVATLGIPQAEPINESFTPQEGAHPVMAFTEAAPPHAPAPPANTAPVVTTIQDDTYG
jgi:hypothetical protein